MANKVYDDENLYKDIPLVTRDAREYLNPRQEIAYRELRRELAEWMLNLGKNPAKADGYSYSTTELRMNRLDMFFRFVWNREQRYVQTPSTRHADLWMKELAKTDYQESTKNHYYILEFFCLLLIFGLLNEAWQSLHPDNMVKEFVETMAKSQTGKQITLLWFIGSAVYMSILLRDMVEAQFGTLSVVQLLALIVILSRIWVNLYTSRQEFRLFDGKPDTYTAYSTGVLAFVLSWMLRDTYPSYTLEHNLLVIWPALAISYLLFYHMEMGDAISRIGEKTSP